MALDRELWLPRLEWADIIVVGGGHTPYLMSKVVSSGLQDILPELMKTRVYVGISAGSIITTPATAPNSAEEPKADAMKLVEFAVQPHYQSERFAPAATKEKVIARKQRSEITYPLYAIDDSTAISVDDGNVTVMSEGEWVIV